jgi:hypothetical protein
MKKLIDLFEEEYKGYSSFLDPETMGILKGQAAQSLKQNLGNISTRQAARNFTQVIGKIKDIESEYIDELEELAVQLVKDQYPIIDYAGIVIDAKITENVKAAIPPPPPSDEEKEEKWEEVPDFVKRRIINGITQGGAVRGAGEFKVMDEYINYLEQLHPDLVEDYGNMLKLIFSTYDDESTIAHYLQLISNKIEVDEGGKVLVKIEPEDDSESDEEPEGEEKSGYHGGTIKIIARANCFPILVHEIIKGLYEVISLFGFGSDKKRNQRIVSTVDTLSNEPEDLQVGKFIHDAINNIYVESSYDDRRIFSLFLKELYQLPENEFKLFIQNAIKKRLTPTQIKWAKDEMAYIDKDLKADEAGVDIDDEDDLYEVKLRRRLQKLAGIKEMRLNDPGSVFTINPYGEIRYKNGRWSNGYKQGNNVEWQFSLQSSFNHPVNDLGKLLDYLEIIDKTVLEPFEIETIRFLIKHNIQIRNINIFDDGGSILAFYTSYSEIKPYTKEL